MDARTRTALEGSIAKWQAIVDGTGKDDGRDNCPLCAKFFDKFCAGCPVDYATGGNGCDTSPYEDWELLVGQRQRYPRKIDSEVTRLAAQAELAFLQSLLPKDGE